MFLFENGAVEFIWLWSALFWPLPLLVSLLPPRERSVQALRVPFFQRIAAASSMGG